MQIDWQSSKTHVLLNPRMPLPLKIAIDSHLNNLLLLEGHIWLATSGTSATTPEQIKLVALSKNALLSSALAVNKHLESYAQDIWFNVLSNFHVGGLGIWARASLSGAKVNVYEGEWNPKRYYNELKNAKATLTSLVPSQLFDLVYLNLSAPKNLRYIVIGGAALQEELYTRAFSLGWPILPSYGLTECSSQVATGILGSPQLKLLSHIDVKINDEGLICLKSPALLSLYAKIDQSEISYEDPKSNGWFQTEDFGELLNGHLDIKGRKSDFIKIGGESVSLTRLEKIFDRLRSKILPEVDCAIFPAPDPRLGHVIHLASAASSLEELHPLMSQYHQEVMPFEKIREVILLSKIPRSPLGKLLRSSLRSQTAKP